MGREGAAVKPGGGEIMLGVEERKVRRGLEGMGGSKLVEWCGWRWNYWRRVTMGDEGVSWSAG